MSKSEKILIYLLYSTQYSKHFTVLLEKLYWLTSSLSIPHLWDSNLIELSLNRTSWSEEIFDSPITQYSVLANQIWRAVENNVFYNDIEKQ